MKDRVLSPIDWFKPSVKVLGLLILGSANSDGFRGSEDEMVDTLTLLFGVIAAVGVLFGISDRLLTKRKDLRESWSRFRVRGRDRLNQQNQPYRKSWIVIATVPFGMALYYYFPTAPQPAWIVIGLGIVWFIIAEGLFRNPEQAGEEPLTKSEVKKLIEE